MRTTNQVSVYPVFQEKRRTFFILVKRNEKRGGFWQPVTGGEEDFDKRDLLRTVVREVREELGINITKKQISRIPYSFKFVDRDGVLRHEQCFGIRLSISQKGRICLSEEHIAAVYSTNIDYLKSLLKFKENRIGLNKFYQWLKTLKD